MNVGGLDVDVARLAASLGKATDGLLELGRTLNRAAGLVAALHDDLDEPDVAEWENEGGATAPGEEG
jgi:hypothetical protein